MLPLLPTVSVTTVLINIPITLPTYDCLGVVRSEEQEVATKYLILKLVGVNRVL